MKIIGPWPTDTRTPLFLSPRAEIVPWRHSAAFTHFHSASTFATYILLDCPLEMPHIRRLLCTVLAGQLESKTTKGNICLFVFTQRKRRVRRFRTSKQMNNVYEADDQCWPDGLAKHPALVRWWSDRRLHRLNEQNPRRVGPWDEVICVTPLVGLLPFVWRYQPNSI